METSNIFFKEGTGFLNIISINFRLKKLNSRRK
jgi:hypothetical protein